MNNGATELVSILYAGQQWQVLDGSLSDEQHLEGHAQLFRRVHPSPERNEEEVVSIKLIGNFHRHRCTQGHVEIRLVNQQVITMTGKIVSVGEHHLFGSCDAAVKYQGRLIQKTAEGYTCQILTTRRDGYLNHFPNLSLQGDAEVTRTVYQDNTPFKRVLFIGTHVDSNGTQGYQIENYSEASGKWLEFGTFDDKHRLHTEEGQRRVYGLTSSLPHRAEKGRYNHGTFTEGIRYTRNTDNSVQCYVGKLIGKRDFEEPDDQQGILLFTESINSQQELCVSFGIEKNHPSKPYFFIVKLKDQQIQSVSLVHEGPCLHEQTKIWTTTYNDETYTTQNHLSSTSPSKLSLIARLITPEVFLPKIRAVIPVFFEIVQSLSSLDQEVAQLQRARQLNAAAIPVSTPQPEIIAPTVQKETQKELKDRTTFFSSRSPHVEDSLKKMRIRNLKVMYELAKKAPQCSSSTALGSFKP